MVLNAGASPGEQGATLRSGTETCLRVEKMTGKRETEKRVGGGGIGAMRSE